MEKALRYNEGKIELSLVPTELIEGVAKVMSYGKNKYTIRREDGSIVESGAENWRKGLPWMDVISSLERHVMAFKKGFDTDSESQLHHLEHAGANLGFLLNYIKTHPELDNRPFRLQSKPKISLDIDDVCAEFVEGWCKKYEMDIPYSWQFDRKINEKLEDLKTRGELEEFFLGLRAKLDPKELPFEPIGYITARPVDSIITETWLDKFGFPTAPVYTVPMGTSKLEIIKKIGATIHVDDNYETYLELNKSGICCYLLDAKHNQKFNVGDRRLHSLLDLKI